MSPLAHQIARLLATENWHEWELKDRRLCHKPSGIALDYCCMACFEVRGHPRRVLPWLDRWRLLRMANRLVDHRRRLYLQESADQLATTLMTAEERAIEELLR